MVRFTCQPVYYMVADPIPKYLGVGQQTIFPLDRVELGCVYANGVLAWISDAWAFCSFKRRRNCWWRLLAIWKMHIEMCVMDCVGQGQRYITAVIPSDICSSCYRRRPLFRCSFNSQSCTSLADFGCGFRSTTWVVCFWRTLLPIVLRIPRDWCFRGCSA